MDALFLEETVETADKTLGKVFRLFRDKELPQILKIAEIIKEEVTDFKPYVPMANATAKYASARIKLHASGESDAVFDKIMCRPVLV